MSWLLEFLPEAVKDLKKLSGNERILIAKAIKKVQTNPIFIHEGGYGKPLGNKSGTNLTGLYKIKLREAGLRLVYKLVKKNDVMLIVVIGARTDNEVYKVAEKRPIKHNL